MLKEATKIRSYRTPKSVTKHYRIHKERPFLFEERETTTVLVGGLSPTHDYLFEAGLRGLGIKAKALPPTNLDAFHLGREYGNNGYCNPAYFTVGNLIRFLKDLELAGVPKNEIIEHYVFFTVGCNAPCRFGMLETEYRMALQDCGFDGFRILVFENEGGLNQKVGGKGVDVNPEFFLAVTNALNMADIVNDLVFATRPFETVAGKTEEVRDEAIKYLYQKLKDKKRIELKGVWAQVFKTLKMTNTATFIYRFLDQLSSSYYTTALKKVNKMFQEVEMDRFKSKTTVKITGEFWAITTEGAGNFNMFHFLEREGALLRVEPVASLIQFLFSKGMLRHHNKKKPILNKGITSIWQIRKRLNNFITFQKKLKTLQLGNYLFRREYRRLLKALGGDYHMLLKQDKLQKIAQPYYNINIEGGEGYMEVAKNIYYHKNNLCHMVLSLKPFGCMPSTQSDGVQAAVIEHHPNIIYLPLETAGDGETNAQSRVLMSLGDARVIAKQELKNARNNVSSTMDEMKAYVEQHPELKKPTYVVPQYNGIINKAANFILHVDELIQKEHT
jgi:predicted nucleotide-binding protein (sugar kinase/HSP70/actin superfamily)